MQEECKDIQPDECEVTETVQEDCKDTEPDECEAMEVSVHNESKDSQADKCEAKQRDVWQEFNKRPGEKGVGGEYVVEDCAEEARRILKYQREKLT